jgi:hypothetical protein
VLRLALASRENNFDPAQVSDVISAALVLHVNAEPPAYDRSDYVKAAGYLTGGGVP